MSAAFEADVGVGIGSRWGPSGCWESSPGRTTNIQSTTHPVGLRWLLAEERRSPRTRPAMTMTSSMMSRTFGEESVVSGADVSSEEYERLALEMLAVEAGDVADVKDAMRRIIASAPDGADVAHLLSLALAYAGDRALRGESTSFLTGEEASPQWRQHCSPASASHQRPPSRWWIAAAMPFLGAAALFWWLGELALKAPDRGTDAAAVAAISMFVISVGSLGAALIGVETLFMLRWQAHSHVALADSLVCPPGWYVDPWGQATSRWWNGVNWTGRVNQHATAVDRSPRCPYDDCPSAASTATGS